MVLGSCVPRRMADSIGEGSSSVNEGPSSVNEGPLSVNEGLPSSTRSVFDVLKAPALSDLTRKRSVRRLRVSVEPVVRDQVNQRASLLHSE